MSDKTPAEPTPNRRTQEFEIEVEQARILKQFISDASHDLRTPLTIIDAAAYMLRIKMLELEQSPELVDRIREQVQRLNTIITDMFTMTTLDSMVLEDTYLQIDFNKIVRNIFREFSVLAQEKNLLYEFYPGEIPTVMVDSTNMWRAIANLVANAIQFTPSGGRVCMRTYEEGDWVIFEVEDTGMGILPEDAPHIFERFYRADKARRTMTGGSGLGLSITKRIVDLHDGKIEFTSVPEQGSTFRVRLPIIQQIARRLSNR